MQIAILRAMLCWHRQGGVADICNACLFTRPPINNQNNNPYSCGINLGNLNTVIGYLARVDNGQE